MKTFAQWWAIAGEGVLGTAERWIANAAWNAAMKADESLTIQGVPMNWNYDMEAAPKDRSVLLSVKWCDGICRVDKGNWNGTEWHEVHGYFFQGEPYAWRELCPAPLPEEG